MAPTPRWVAPLSLTTHLLTPLPTHLLHHLCVLPEFAALFAELFGMGGQQEPRPQSTCANWG